MIAAVAVMAMALVSSTSHTTCVSASSDFDSVPELSFAELSSSSSDSQHHKAKTGQWWLESAPWFLPPPPEWGPMPVTMYTSYYHKPAPGPVHLDYAAGIPLPQADALNLARKTYPQAPFSLMEVSATTHTENSEKKDAHVSLAETQAEASADLGLATTVDTSAEVDMEYAVQAALNNEMVDEKTAEALIPKHRSAAEIENALRELSQGAEGLITKITATF